MSLAYVGQPAQELDRAVQMKIGDTVRTRLGTVTRSTGGGFELTTGGTRVKGVAPGLYDSDSLYVAAFDDWLVALAEEGFELQVWREGEDAVRELARVERIVFTGYNPGGFYRVRIVQLPLNRCLVATEESVNVVDREGGLVWSLDHGDCTTNVVRLSADRVVIMNEYDYTALRLSDGAFIDSEPHD